MFETRYLNNSGSRWVALENGEKISLEFKTISGKTIKRKANFFEQFGNFATAQISWKGKKVMVFTNSILPD